jgi:glutathione S-transferase-like protein
MNAGEGVVAGESEIVVHQLPGGVGAAVDQPVLSQARGVAEARRAALSQRGRCATPFGGPKRKLPYIELEGRKIGDSGFIIDHLVSRFGRDPDADLSPAERAAGHALRRLIEENFYWVLVYDRWAVDENWRTFRNVVLGGVPALLRGVLRQLRGHGIGLHSREDASACATWLRSPTSWATSRS